MQKGIRRLVPIVGAVIVAAALASAATAGEYRTRVVAGGLDRPTGIAAMGNGTLYFTEIPTPGVPGTAGGLNGVRVLTLGNGAINTINDGEPEPVNLAVGRGGTLYWTCKSAGVILERQRDGSIAPFLQGLAQPSGIAVDKRGDVLFTQVPSPGVPGPAGGTNTVSASDGKNTTVLTLGEPEPTDIAVAADGTAYWTCKSAGVILRKSPAGVVSLLLSNLDHPVGIALDHRGKNLFWTEVPTPGMSGNQGGRNSVQALDLVSMQRSTVDVGDPEPTDITVTRNGNLYWTCSSAGVIVEAEPRRH